MKAELQIFFWWLMFGATHIVGSSIPVRQFFIGRLGKLKFKAVYSLVALATFIPLCYVYFSNKNAGMLFFQSGYFVKLLAHFIMLAALIVLLQALITTNPLTTIAELSGREIRIGRGIQRITRHPQNFAFGLFGLAHLLANPYAGDWIFFGGFMVYAILSSIHQDRRMQATGNSAVRKFLSDTSAVPFAALITGRQHLALEEYHPPALAAAVVLFILIRLLHPMLFGGFGG